MSSLQEIIHIVQEEARAQEENVPGAHLRLLEATEKLRHKVESPGDALARFRFQVSLNAQTPLCSCSYSITYYFYVFVRR